MHPYKLDDISYYQNIFKQFGYDDTSIFYGGIHPDQISVHDLENMLRSEYQKDAMHQLEFWIYRDKAGEVVNLIEHNQPNDDGASAVWRTFRQEAATSHPLVNLIKPNANRIVAQMLQVDNNFGMKHKNPKDKDLVRNVNYHKDAILRRNNWDQHWNDAIDDAGTFGSGVVEILYEKSQQSMDLNHIVRKATDGGHLTDQELMDLYRAMYDHKIAYRDTFDVVNYRGARGKKDRLYRGPGHRWVHINDTISVSKAKQLYPEYEDRIVPGIDYYYKELRPALFSQVMNEDDVVSRTRTQVKFPVIQLVEAPIVGKDGQVIAHSGEIIRRTIMVEFVRLYAAGVVDITVDQYNHGDFTVHQIMLNSSSYHSKGIGAAKFGIDGQKIYNMYHAGLLKYLGKQIKSGGIVDTRLGISASQLRQLSQPGKFVEAKLPSELRDKKIGDLIKTFDPPSFPSTYPNMMALESRAVDESMSVPESMKGIQQGTSGDQEDILQRQGAMTHNPSQQHIITSLHPIAESLCSNIVQYDTYPIDFYEEDPLTGEYKRIQLNMPEAYVPYFDAYSGEMMVKPVSIRNAISGLQYKVDIGPTSYVPKDPHQKAQLIMNLIDRIHQSAGNPAQLEAIRSINSLIYNIPQIDDLLDKVVQEAKKMQQVAIQESQTDKQFERMIKEAELKLKGFDKQLRNKQIDQQMDKAYLDAIKDKVPALIPQIANEVLKALQENNQISNQQQ